MYETPEEQAAFFKSLFQFRVERFLGQGAFGMAILVFDEVERIPKVFKLPKDDMTTNALKVEGANLVNLRNLKHKNIILLHQYGKTLVEWNHKRQERYYLLLAYGGVNLRAKLGEPKRVVDRDGNAFYFGSGRQLPLQEALRISIDVCQGLEAAHGFVDPAVRILHRDIKPENILIDETTNDARIADFGISRIMDRSSGIVSVAGTLLYMDPECFQGRAKYCSDLYSLAVVMYEMFTGELPFENFPVRLQRGPADPRTINPQIPDEVARVILKGLQNDVTRRFACATEMLADLRRAWVSLNPLPHGLTKVKSLDHSVFLCDDAELGRRAVVRIADSDISIAQLEREATRLQACRLDCVVPPVRFFRAEQNVGIVAPVPEGQSLEERFAKTLSGRATQQEECCQTLARLCDAMARCHTAGVVHGCLYPEAVFLAGDGSLRIHGFCAGPILAARTARDNAGAKAFRDAFGPSLAFMSPQLLRGGYTPDASDDTFSVGAILHLLLTGKPPYPSGDGLAQVLGGAAAWPEVPRPREANTFVTRRLEEVLQKALQWQPEMRFASMSEMANALRACKWPDDLIDTLTTDALGRYENGDTLGAYDLLDKAIIEDPGNAEVHYVRGLIYLREKDHRWAAEELRAAVQVSPERKTLLLLAKCCLEWKGHLEEAIKVLLQALSEGETAEARWLMAQALRLQGQSALAAGELERAAQLEEDPAKRQERFAMLQQWKESAGRPPQGLQASVHQPPAGHDS